MMPTIYMKSIWNLITSVELPEYHCNNDGCNSSCSGIKNGWICVGGSPTSKDTCTVCPAGYSPNTAKDACITVCGDGLRAGTEVCDDANTANNDGCSSTCATIESNYICTGGSTTSRDTCTACTSGFVPNTAKTSCISV